MMEAPVPMCFRCDLCIFINVAGLTGNMLDMTICVNAIDSSGLVSSRLIETGVTGCTFHL